jgi:predicted amidophosphoribosyltransferase
MVVERSLWITYVCCSCQAGWWTDTGDDRCRLCGEPGEIRGETLSVDLTVQDIALGGNFVHR